MKTKIISLLLLVSMLITAVPVMAAAAEEAQSVATNVVTDYDYHDKYVTDGIVGLFTAFDANDASVSLADGKGTWLNRVSGKPNATFAGKSWEVLANGGVGYKYVYGTVKDGVYSTTNTKNNFDYLNRLVFGLDLLPKQDYTLEYVALYTPMYAWNADASTYVPAHNYTDANGAAPAGQYTERVVDMIGLIHTFDCYRGGSFDGGVGYVRWRVAPKDVWADETLGSSWGATTELKNKYGFGLHNTRDRNTGDIATYTLIHDRAADVTQGDKTIYSATYYFYYNGVGSLYDGKSATGAGASKKFSSANATNSYLCYYNEGADTDFYLSQCTGTDFYAVRIYDRVLSVDERNYNHMIDVLEWYNLKADKSFFGNADRVSAFLNASKNVTFITDAVLRASKALELQSVIDKLHFSEVKNMYVQDGLVEQYTVYDDSLNLSDGTWTGVVNGTNATFRNKDNWSVNANGSVGFTSFCGVMVDGTYAKSGTGNKNNYTAGNRLVFNMGLLSNEDFTVEYMAMYKPLYVYDANQADKIARDASGNKIETYSQDVATTGLFIANGNVDNLGWFQSITSALDGQIYSGWVQGTTPEQTRGAVHWVFGHNNGDSSGWYMEDSSRQRWWLGSSGACAPAGGLHILSDAFQTNNRIRTYAITVDESIKVVEDETYTEALFSLYRDGGFYNSNASKINSTANNNDTNGNGKPGKYKESETVNGKTTHYYEDWSKGYFDWDYDSTARFWLSNNRPTDFFGVRIYDRTLTIEEFMMNRFVDLLLYYGIRLSEEVLTDGDLLAAVAVGAATVPFATDEVGKNAAKAQITDLVKINEQTLFLYSLYVQNGLVANYTALSSLDASASVENGVWTNRVVGGDPAVFGNAQYWYRNDNGSVGFDIFYGSYIDGVFTGDVATNNYATLGTKLDLGIKNLPKDDFTVEFVAQTKPVYAVDADGKIAGESYLLNGNPPGSQQYKASIFQLGYLGGWTTNIDGTHGGTTHKRGSLAWVIGAGDYGWTQTCGYTRMDYQTEPVKDVFFHAGYVHSYAITRNEFADTADASKIAATYVLCRDAAAHTTMLYDSTVKPGNEAYKAPDFSKDDGATFALFHRLPADLYAVRVYNRVLTGDEMIQNHMVDIVSYYDLTLPAEVYASEAVLLAVASTLASASIVTDKTVVAANKIAYQTRIDETVAAATATSEGDYASLYVKSGLVGLYTAFTGDPSLDLVNGIWENKIDGAYGDATFRGATYWTRMGKGVGYSFTMSQYSLDKKNVGLSLPESFASLPNFTVETFATAVGITNEDGSRYVNVYTEAYTDEQGNTVPVSGAIYGYYITGNSTFRFELLCSVFFNSLYKNGTNYNRADSLGQRWFICNYGYNGNPSGDKGVTINSSDQTWRNVGDPFVPTALVMQTTRSVNEAGDITYAIAYNNQAVGSSMSTTVTAANHAKYLKQSNTDSAGRFSLFNGLPGIVYAIRVYNDLLTADEKAQNRLVDLMYYHDVVVPAGLTHDSEAMKTIAACANKITISEDAVKKAANKATIEAAIAAASSRVNIVAGADAQKTIYAVGSTYTLPTMIDGQAVVAWTASNAAGGYLPGASIALTNDMTVTAVVIDAPKTNSKVSIKPMSSSDGLAIRFTALFDRADMETILDLYDNVSVGMLIAPVKYVQAAGGVFTREALRNYVVANGVAADRAFVEVVATGFFTIGEETLTLAASLANFSATTKAKNPDFTAVAFVDIDADNDGVVDYTVYGSYNALAKHNVKTVMQKALGGALTDTQKNWINSLLKDFGA